MKSMKFKKLIFLLHNCPSGYLFIFQKLISRIHQRETVYPRISDIAIQNRN